MGCPPGPVTGPVTVDDRLLLLIPDLLRASLRSHARNIIQRLSPTFEQYTRVPVQWVTKNVERIRKMLGGGGGKVQLSGLGV